jgi:hypothetical protein
LKHNTSRFTHVYVRISHWFICYSFSLFHGKRGGVRLDLDQWQVSKKLPMSHPRDLPKVRTLRFWQNGTRNGRFDGTVFTHGKTSFT